MTEWLKACRGPQGWVYPYGNVEKKDQCNSGKPHLLLKKFGHLNPYSWKYDEQFNAPSLSLEPGFLAETASYEGCTGDGSTYDMVGNLHEWVSDTVDHTLPNKIALIPQILNRLPDNLGHGIFMGGFYSTGGQHGIGCGFITIGHEPSYHDYSTGFRCCKDAQVENPSPGAAQP